MVKVKFPGSYPDTGDESNMMTSGNRNPGHVRGGGNSGQGRGNQTVSTPTFFPASGSFVSSTQVAVVCATEGATVRYTTDGSTPTGLSPIYTSPLTVTTTTTIKAIAHKNGYVTSAMGQALFTIAYPALSEVTFSPAAGYYEEVSLQVTLSHIVPGVTIYYTTNGSTPTTSSTVYAGPFTLVPEIDPITVKAIAVKTGWSNSAVATAIYDLVTPVLPTVVLSNPGMIWDSPTLDRGTLTMDYAVTHEGFPVAYVEFQWSTDDINFNEPGEYNPSDSTTWQQQDVADKTAVPETFYMRARYVSENTPSPTVAGPWSTSLFFDTGDYPF